MTRDLTPTSHDVWRVVEKYGSIGHAATAIGAAREEMEAWLSGRKQIPIEYYDALLALIGSRKE
jgi:hypothetical protein